MPEAGLVNATGIKVPVKAAESVRRYLKERGLLDAELVPARGDDFVVFPVKMVSGEDIYAGLQGELVRFDFAERPSRPGGLKEVLKKSLSESELEGAPSSFDIVGDIAVVHIPAALRSKASLIGEAIMKAHRSVRVVLGEASRFEGLYRTRKYVHLAGENRTYTVHRENGCRFIVDLSTTYFTPRLSGERMRIASLVSKTELVADLFAGVGPFSITIAKHAEALVHASELNPHAYEMLLRNIEANKLSGGVVPHYGDCREVFKSISLRFDRIIMNYPSDPLAFLETALSIIGEGGTIHLYGFAEDIDSWRKLIIARIEEQGGACRASVRALRPVSPRRSLAVADVEVYSTPERGAG
jgi:tRNA (guanine37-N1)-methyltransferase